MNLKYIEHSLYSGKTGDLTKIKKYLLDYIQKQHKCLYTQKFNDFLKSYFLYYKGKTNINDNYILLQLLENLMNIQEKERKYKNTSKDKEIFIKKLEKETYKFNILNPIELIL